MTASALSLVAAASWYTRSLHKCMAARAGVHARTSCQRNAVLMSRFLWTSSARFYSQVFPESGRDDTALLDVCSSWVSHYPPGYKAGKVAGLGMSECNQLAAYQEQHAFHA